MSSRYVPYSWNLRCPWCSFYIIVNPRGMRGNDPGSGVEAAQFMERHAAEMHQKTWADFLVFTGNRDLTKPDRITSV